MKPRERRNIDAEGDLPGEGDLPLDWKFVHLLGVTLLADLDRVLTHSLIERDDEEALLYLDGELRGVGKLNQAGQLEGELAILRPTGGLRIIAYFKDGKPSGRWREFTPRGELLPGKPLEWVSEEQAFHQDPGAFLH